MLLSCYIRILQLCRKVVRPHLVIDAMNEMLRGAPAKPKLVAISRDLYAYSWDFVLNAIAGS
jgi:hypothetical protein